VSGRIKWLIGACAAAVVALLVVALWHFRSGGAETADKIAEATEDARPNSRKVRGDRKTIKRSAPVVQEEPAKDGGEVVDSGRQGGDEEPEMTAKTEEEIQAEKEEALVDAFDGMTDKWREPTEAEVPMAEVENFRQQFNKIPQARQEECLQRALNLLPDENIMLLAGILLDKSQPEEYLELVYNDILNRDESVKNPLLKEIFKDKEHPCWVTTAWILDVTGEMPGK